MSAPTTYADSNDRSNDPFDHDTVCWMLEQPGVADSWTYHNLFECARKQRNRIENDLDRVIGAANLCGRLGVEQLELHDPRIGKDIVRLRRTDSGKPDYPAHYDASDSSRPFRMPVTRQDREAANLLLALIRPYEDELVAAGKSRSTVSTYVDRAERFLKRVAAPGVSGD
ncbi:MAG TPA: hypothetical protein VNQ73_04340 [Ilumatobacter sp.]|nr:hypothetical protein [Ilumatobacter sp.]